MFALITSSPWTLRPLRSSVCLQKLQVGEYVVLVPSILYCLSLIVRVPFNIERFTFNVPKTETGIIVDILSATTSPRMLYWDSLNFSIMPLNSHPRQLIDGRLKIPPTASNLVPSLVRPGWLSAWLPLVALESCADRYEWHTNTDETNMIRKEILDDNLVIWFLLLLKILINIWFRGTQIPSLRTNESMTPAKMITNYDVVLCWSKNA